MIRCQTRSGWGKTLMKLLLDTHTFLWADMDPDRLSAQARSLLANPENERLLSSASLWEIQIKVMLGKLTLRVSLPDFVREAESRRSILILPIRPQDIFEVSVLPSIHNDPFDRLIVAVARVENATVVSADPIIKKYPVPVVW